MGHLEYELHEYDAAVESYARLLELEPAHRTGHFNRAVCLGRLGRWEEAAAAFEPALQLDPARDERTSAWAPAWSTWSAPRTPCAVFNSYLQPFPDHEEALFGKAVAMQLAKRYDEAAEIYRKILARNPRSEQCSPTSSSCTWRGRTTRPCAQCRKAAGAFAG